MLESVREPVVMHDTPMSMHDTPMSMHDTFMSVKPSLGVANRELARTTRWSMSEHFKSNLKTHFKTAFVGYFVMNLF